MTRKARKAPTVRIHNLGCGKNAVDAEVMAGFLSEGGFLVVPGGRADAAVLTTCGFVRAAKEESIEAILSLAAEKRRGWAKISRAGAMGVTPRNWAGTSLRNQWRTFFDSTRSVCVANWKKREPGSRLRKW